MFVWWVWVRVAWDAPAAGECRLLPRGYVVISRRAKGTEPGLSPGHSTAGSWDGAFFAAGSADTAGNTHAANIDALAAAGVTAGCRTDPLSYCPDQPVTRAQLATFLRLRDFVGFGRCCRCGGHVTRTPLAA